MSQPTGFVLSPVYTNTWWAARLEGLSEHHVRRRARAGQYEGAFRRDDTGRWMIPLASITRTLDATVRHYMDTTAATVQDW